MPPNHPLHRRSAALLGLAAVLGCRRAAAQGQGQGQGQGQAERWPERPVRLLVPYGAGGASDTLSRIVAQAFPQAAGDQTMVVENRGGAGGTIAGAATAQARPDGTTLMLGDLGPNGIAQELIRGIAYDPLTAFTPICHLVNLPVVIVVNPALRARTAADLFDLARARAATPLTYAHPGIGYVTQLAQEQLLRQTGTRMVAVPYRSGAEVLRSLIAGECDCAIPTVSTALPFIRDGKVRAIAVCSLAPVAQLPGVPTLAATLPGFEVSVWHGIVGPAGMSPDLVAAANRVFNAIMRRPEVVAKVEATQAAQVAGGTPEQFAALIKADVARWTPLIRELGLRAE